MEMTRWIRRDCGAKGSCKSRSRWCWAAQHHPLYQPYAGGSTAAPILIIFNALYCAAQQMSLLRSLRSLNTYPLLERPAALV